MATAGDSNPRRGWLEVVNWRRAQKYRKENPPWIKLYTSLFDYPGWLALDDRSARLLIQLWLYAARRTLDGRIWGDPEFLREVLHWQGPLDLEPLLSATDEHGKPAPFLKWAEPAAPAAPAGDAGPGSAGGFLQAGLQPETEAKAEAEREAEREAETKRKRKAETKERERDKAESGEPRVPSPESRAQAQARQRQRHSESESQSQSQSPGTGPGESQTESRPVPGSIRILSNPNPPPGISAGPLVSDGRSVAGPEGSLAGRSPPAGPGEGRPLGGIMASVLAGWIDPARADWVRAVYGALGFPWPLDSVQAREQTGSFESVYDRLMALRELPPETKRVILEHDLIWARKNGQKKRNRKRGAVFVAVHKRRVAEYLTRAGPSRA